MTADDPPDQSFVTEMVEATGFAIALTGGVNQGQVARLGQTRRRQISVRFQKQVFKGNRDVFGKAGADKTAGGDRVAGPNQADRLTGAHHLAAFGNAE